MIHKTKFLIFRYAKANNKYYMKEYDPEKETKYIMYYDVNNLYGYAMLQNLPSGDFQWMSGEEIETFDVSKIADDSQKGYMLEVDLEYPEILHDEHKDLPFCPQHKIPRGSKQKKLLTTLYDKEKYVIHYRYLKQVLDHGLKITKIHKILTFNQSKWLEKYINKNSDLRKLAKNDFEKNFFKLMNNSIYGKTMENVRKRVDVKLRKTWEGRFGVEALISKPNFKSCSIFNDNLVAIELKKLEVVMDKPIYVGLSVLDISKIVLYEFHYDYVRKVFGNNCKLLYTDTDSLIYEIICEDIYDVMKKDSHRFDTSDYDENNVYGIPLKNKKIVGLMKDECNGKPITEFAALRSKMYSIRVEGEDHVKKVKGIKYSVVKNTINFDHFKDCLFNDKQEYRDQYKIVSKHHIVYTEKQTKLALSGKDDKRYLLNSVDTLPWGHKDIKED